MKPAGRIWRLGAFEIVKDLAAKGAQGKLYVGRALEAAFPGIRRGDLVALKVMPDHGDDSARDFKRLTRRTNALIAAANPGIVRYYGCFASSQGFEDIHVLVMELLNGQTLEELLKSNKLGLDADDVLRIIRSCADALVICAEHGLVHRDIKPSNIFICDDGSAKLIDFEIARQDGASRTTTESGAMRGTVDYMAPDFHPDFRPDKGFRGDECSDVFSLTVCLYEMLAGSRPYAAGGAMGEQSMMAFFQRWTKVEGVDVSKALKIETFRIHALAHVQRIIKKGLSPERSGRYQTYREFADALKGVALREIASPSARYELLRCVGKGGFGVVFRGRRKSDGLVVAIKALLKPEYSERFIREAKTLARFNDGRLVSFVEYFKSARAATETHFIVMQFLDGMPGSSLRDRIAAANDKHLSIPPREIAAAFARFAGGLGVMHRAGIVHRDIKPANLYMPDGAPERASVMDLGVVKTDETQTQGSLPGTLDYMAPEMALGTSRGSPAVDIYALGLCLHEALTGQPVYPRLKRGGDGFAEFYRRAKDGDRPDISRLDDRPTWRSLVAAMIEPDPERRIRDSDEILRLLARIPAAELADPDEVRRRRISAELAGSQTAHLGREVGLYGATTEEQYSSESEPVAGRQIARNATPSDGDEASLKRRSRIMLPDEPDGGVPPQFSEEHSEAPTTPAETKAKGRPHAAISEAEEQIEGSETNDGAETHVAVPEAEVRAEVDETRVGDETHVALPEVVARDDAGETRVGDETNVAAPEVETRADEAKTSAGDETRVAVPDVETRAEVAETRATVATSALDGTLADLTKTHATVATPDFDVTKTRATVATPESGFAKTNTTSKIPQQRRTQHPPENEPKPEPTIQPQPKPQLKREPKAPEPKLDSRSPTKHKLESQPKRQPKPEQSVVIRKANNRPWLAALFVIVIGAAFGAAFYLRQKAEDLEKNGIVPPPIVVPGNKPPVVPPIAEPGNGKGKVVEDPVTKPKDPIVEAENSLVKAMQAQESSADALCISIAKADDLTESSNKIAELKAEMSKALDNAKQTAGVAEGETYRNAAAKRTAIETDLDTALTTRQGILDAIAKAEKVLNEAIAKQEATTNELCAAIAKADDLTESRSKVKSIKDSMSKALETAALTAGVAERETYRNAAAKRTAIETDLDTALTTRQGILDAIAKAEKVLNEAMAKQEATTNELCSAIATADDLTESRSKVKSIKDAISKALKTAAQTVGVAERETYRNAAVKRTAIETDLDTALTTRQGILDATAKAEKALGEAMAKQEADAASLCASIAKTDDLTESSKKVAIIKGEMSKALEDANQTAGVAERETYRIAAAKRTAIETDLDNAIAKRKGEKASRQTAEENVKKASEAVNKLKERVGRISDRRSHDEAVQEAETLTIPAQTGYADLDKSLGKLRTDLDDIKASLAKKASAEVKNGGNVPIIVSVGNSQKRIDASGEAVFRDLAVWSTTDFSAKADGTASADYETAKNTIELKGGDSKASIGFNLAYKGDPKLEISNANDSEVVATVGGNKIKVPANGSASFTSRPRETIVVNYSCDEAHEIRNGGEARIQMGDAGTSRKTDAPVLEKRPRHITVVDPLDGNVTWHVRVKPDGEDLGHLGAGNGNRELTVPIPIGVGTIYLVPEPLRLSPKNAKKQSRMKTEYEIVKYDVSNVPYGKTERWEPKPKTIQANRVYNIKELKSSGMEDWFWVNPGPAHDFAPEVVKVEYEFLKYRVREGLPEPNIATHASIWLRAAKPMSRLMSPRYEHCRNGDGDVATWLEFFKTNQSRISELANGKSDGHEELGECIKMILANQD
ncbi:MAG: protein kinase [Kiritimatiellae bacterium]|nr:protein kinase [Kiritimatiellia bacterium]